MRSQVIWHLAKLNCMFLMTEIIIWCIMFTTVASSDLVLFFNLVLSTWGELRISQLFVSFNDKCMPDLGPSCPIRISLSIVAETSMVLRLLSHLFVDWHAVKWAMFIPKLSFFNQSIWKKWINSLNMINILISPNHYFYICHWTVTHILYLES